MDWREAREYGESIAIAVAIAALLRLAGVQAPEWMRPYTRPVFGSMIIVFLIVGLVLRPKRGQEDGAPPRR